jgi:hypothetical protein
MRTHLHQLTLPNWKSILATSAFLTLAPALALASPQQSSSPAAPAAAPAGNPAQTAQTGPVISTRAITESRRPGATTGTATNNPTAAVNRAATTTGALTTQQRVDLQQQLVSMDSRLDDLIAAMNSSTGTQRSEAVTLLVRELATQLSTMRQALLASGVTSLDTLADNQAIFITPSGTVMAQQRRHGLDLSPNAAAGASSAGVIQSRSTAGLTAQAQSRRTGDPNEPMTVPNGG